MKSAILNNKFKLLSFVILITIVLLTLFSEKSDLFEGGGSDGIFMEDFIPNLNDHFQNKNYPSEAMNRLLPAMIARTVYLIISVFKSDQVHTLSFGNSEIGISKNLMATFELLNIIYLSVSVFIFLYILYIKNISFRIAFFAVSLYFLNFMFLKQFFFEPVFFDQFYLFYSSLLFFSVLTEKKWLLNILIILSFFANVLATIFSLIIVLIADKGKFSILFSRKYILLSFSLAFIFISFYLLKNPLCTEYSENKSLFNLSYLSISLALCYILIMITVLIPEEFKITLSGNLSLFVSFFLGITIFITIGKLISRPYNFDICIGLKGNILNQILNNIRQVNSRPVGFLSSHFNYLGLLFIFILLSGNTIRKFLKLNQRFVPIVIFFIFSTLTSESRYLTPFIPFLLIMMTDKFDFEQNSLHFFLTNKGLFIIVVFNLIWSGFYIKINPLDTKVYADIAYKFINFDAMFHTPLQKYFKHLGPWTSNDSYIWQLSVFFITLFLILIYLKWHVQHTKNKINL